MPRNCGVIHITIEPCTLLVQPTQPRIQYFHRGFLPGVKPWFESSVEVNSEYSYSTYPIPFVCIRDLHGTNLTFSCVFIIFKFFHWGVNSFFKIVPLKKLSGGIFWFLAKQDAGCSHVFQRKREDQRQAQVCTVHFAERRLNSECGVKEHPLGVSRWPPENLCKNLQILLINLLKHEVHLQNI